MLAMLYWLGVKPSYSRPRVSDDNAFAESLFRTAKYRPEFPAKGFVDPAAARAWATTFVRWYNVIDTAESAMSASLSDMPATITRSSQCAVCFTPRLVSAIRPAGPARRATGRQSVQSRSTRNATRS